LYVLVYGLGPAAVVLADRYPQKILVRVADALIGARDVEEANAGAVLVLAVEDQRWPEHGMPPELDPAPLQEFGQKNPNCEGEKEADDTDC
jgi:hypothetical protein